MAGDGGGDQTRSRMKRRERGSRRRQPHSAVTASYVIRVRHCHDLFVANRDRTRRLSRHTIFLCSWIGPLSSTASAFLTYVRGSPSGAQVVGKKATVQDNFLQDTDLAGPHHVRRLAATDLCIGTAGLDRLRNDGTGPSDGQDFGDCCEYLTKHLARESTSHGILLGPHYQRQSRPCRRRN